DPAGQKLIQVDIDQRNMGITRPLELGIVADAKSALEGLTRMLKTKRAQPKSGEHMARYRQAAQEYREKRFAAVTKWQGPGIHPAHAMQTIGKVFGADSIFVADGGNTSLWSLWFLPSTRPRSFLNILELG